MRQLGKSLLGPMAVGKRLFGTRGIRGPVHVRISPELALRLGLALAGVTGGGEVVIGRDTRVTGEMMVPALSAGLMAGGSDVINIGVVPSPCLAFAVRELGAAAGVMVTASHNPPSDNGFVFYTLGGSEFTDKMEIELERLVLDDLPRMVGWEGVGGLTEVNVLEDYLRWLEKTVRVEAGLRVVVDPANGAASGVTPVLLRRIGCEVLTINSHPDGHFPGRPAEPQPWNLTGLMRVVAETGADLGVAHDGDADRVAVVDEKGRFVRHDALIALFAGEAAGRNPGGTVVTSVNTSRAVEEVVWRVGGKVVRVPLGKFTEGILEHGACFAGEPGKLVFPEHAMWADGILSAVKVVELVAREGKPISEVLADRVPDYPMRHEDFPCGDGTKPAFIQHMKEFVLREVGEVERVIDTDGIRVERSNGSWVLVRVSGTEPKARVVVEGRTIEELELLWERVAGEARRFLEKAGRP
jgi:phosphoglucosamine mutase